MKKNYLERLRMDASKKGFTLIELLIVVAIIAIMASVVLVSLMGAREKSKIARFKSQSKAVQTRAVAECGAANISSNFLGGNTATYNLTSVSGSCGSGGNFSFTVVLTSQGLSTPCTATARETGIISFNGC